MAERPDDFTRQINLESRLSDCASAIKRNTNDIDRLAEVNEKEDDKISELRKDYEVLKVQVSKIREELDATKKITDDLSLKVTKIMAIGGAALAAFELAKGFL